MSIYAYTGLPGSGKSYSVVEHQILPALKSGRRVVTNVALHFDKLRAAFPGVELVEFPTDRVRLDPATLYEYVLPGSVFILDEVWKIFPAGQKVNHVPDPFKKLLAEHRHMVDASGNSVQVVLVTQDLAQIGPFARQLVEQTFRTVKLTTVGLSGQFRVDVYNGPATGPNPPESTRIRQIYGHYASAVWQYYQTHTLKADPASSSKVNEKAIDRRANILRRPGMIVGAVAVLGLIGFGVSSLVGLYQSRTGGAPLAADAATGAPPERLPVSRVITSPGSVVAAAAGAVRETSSPDDKQAQLVGVIVNHDNADASMALVKIGERIVSRPLRYCSDLDGWWQCKYPDLGYLSL